VPRALRRELKRLVMRTDEGRGRKGGWGGVERQFSDGRTGEGRRRGRAKKIMCKKRRAERSQRQMKKVKKKYKEGIWAALHAFNPD
jgi:hypothetical protein